MSLARLYTDKTVLVCNLPPNVVVDEALVAIER